MADYFNGMSDTASGPALRCFVITPHATNELPAVTKGIRAPSDGVITLRAVGDSADVAHPVFAGEIIQVGSGLTAECLHAGAR